MKVGNFPNIFEGTWRMRIKTSWTIVVDRIRTVIIESGDMVNIEGGGIIICD